MLDSYTNYFRISIQYLWLPYPYLFIGIYKTLTIFRGKIQKKSVEWIIFYLYYELLTVFVYLLKIYCLLQLCRSDKTMETFNIFLFKIGVCVCFFVPTYANLDK